jgi:hypothetical protein
LTKDWFDLHPVKTYSPAMIAYMMLVSPTFEDTIIKKVQERTVALPNSMEWEQAIAKEEGLAGLLRLMRRKESFKGEQMLRNKLLLREQEAVPAVQKMLLTTALDGFVEQAVNLFIYCGENHSGWLLENYDKIRYPYARSMLCLLLGFRGDSSANTFLMNQVELMERQWPGEDYAQGPLVALYVLSGHYYLTWPGVARVIRR